MYTFNPPGSFQSETDEDLHLLPPPRGARCGGPGHPPQFDCRAVHSAGTTEITGSVHQYSTSLSRFGACWMRHNGFWTLTQG